MLVTPMVAEGQIERVTNAFQLARFAALPTGDYVYDYRLVGPGKGSKDIYSDVFLDVSAPKTNAKPSMLGSRGNFLFDALNRNFSEAEFSHPPLFVGTPAPWWIGSIWMSGAMNWSATRYDRGANYGVKAGEQLLGFELRSPAVPSLRRWRVVPYRPFDGDEGSGPDGPKTRVDSSWVVSGGVTLGPGWPVESLTGAFLQMQVGLACEGYLLTNCGHYLLLVDAVMSSEVARNDASWTRGLNAMHEYVMADTKSSSTARYAINTATGALLRRLPSKRPQVAPQVKP